jgi:hypothetical protein
MAKDPKREDTEQIGRSSEETASNVADDFDEDDELDEEDEESEEDDL